MPPISATECFRDYCLTYDGKLAIEAPDMKVKPGPEASISRMYRCGVETCQLVCTLRNIGGSIIDVQSLGEQVECARFTEAQLAE